jgi:hypothetical protein
MRLFQGGDHPGAGGAGGAAVLEND